jgi:DHA1 family multidrug resistance protein-like MFS transporter
MKAHAIQLLSNAGIYGPVIIVPVILQEQFFASTSLIGVIAGGVAAAGFVSSYVFGRASDMYGRRMILVLGLFLSGIATLAQLASLVWGGIELFAWMRLLIGFCSGIFPAALLAYAYGTRSTRMGRFSAFGAAGWGIGNLAVGLFGVFYEAAYLFCAILIFASFALALMLPFSKEVKMDVPLFPVKLIRKNASVYSAMLVRHTGANMIWVTYPLFLRSIGADNEWIGLIYGVNSFGQFFFMMLLDRYDPAILVALGLVSSAATFFTFTLVGNFWEILPSQLLLAFAWSCLYVGSLRYLMDRNEEKATVTGLLSSTTSISGILGPLFGGFAATAFGFKGTIAIATAMSIAAFFVFLYELDRSGELYRLRARSRTLP